MWGPRGLPHPVRARAVRVVGGCAVSIAVAVTAAGCGGSGGADAGRTLPPVTTSATAPTQSTTTDPPHLSRKQELAAAEATVRRYFKAINALHSKMDAGPLAQLMTHECICQAQVRAVRRYAARGDRYIDRTRIVAMAGAIDGLGLVDVVVTYDAGPSGLDDRHGKALTRTPPASGLQRRFLVVQRDDRWLIEKIVNVT